MVSRTMSPAQITEARPAPPRALKLVAMPGLEIRYLGFNTEAPVVKDKAVRQAIAQLVDRGQLVSKVYGIHGRAALLAGPDHHHRPHQLVLQQVRRRQRAKAADC